MRLTLVGGVPLEVDTGLQQVAKAYDQTGGPSNPAEPPLGLMQADQPAAGSLPASRIMVIPLPPIVTWLDVTIVGEPWFDTDTNTIKVVLLNSDGVDVDVNVLFWNPHTSISPGQADPYGVDE